MYQNVLIEGEVMQFVRCSLIATLLMTPACSSEANTATARKESPLLATDLVYEKLDGNKGVRLTLDPWLANHPMIAREIRDELLTSLSAKECKWATGCSVVINVEVQYSGDRLVSLMDFTRDDGDMIDPESFHPSMKAADRIYDTVTGKRLRFRDIFSSWPAAREILQRQFCDGLKQSEACPSIEEQAMGLYGWGDLIKNEGIAYVNVQRSGHVPGSHDIWPDKVLMDITPELIAWAKPEYRPFFDYQDYSKPMLKE